MLLKSLPVILNPLLDKYIVAKARRSAGGRRQEKNNYSIKTGFGVIEAFPITNATIKQLSESVCVLDQGKGLFSVLGKS